ncbi:UNVERIFIED_CONTAM: hypothetical protein K2H54_025024 [Gekko kuhli]
MEFFCIDLPPCYSIALDPAQNVSTGSWKSGLEIKQRPTQHIPLGGTCTHTQNCSQHHVLESSFPSPFKAIRQMPLPLQRSDSTDFPELTLPVSRNPKGWERTTNVKAAVRISAPMPFKVILSKYNPSPH